ncbi:MAG: glycyl-radical enzyme activating protein [Deltaproteobacteria bacterium]|nr:glycyl-radical enzyme activating protein [Deltaproteobacteria bacterium]
MEKTAAIIFDTQRFCLHDGPGIRTVVFFKGCPLRCKWCQNPESHKKEPELFFSQTRCILCGDCVPACPAGALDLEKSIRINYSLCNACGRCVNKCASGALRIAGRKWDLNALAAEALKDRDYFEQSGGGITLSGGEPLVQHAFVREFCTRMKAKGVHILVETCGFFNWENLTPVIPMVDMFYFDLKIMDADIHKKYTGVSNAGILKNFMRLCETGAPVQPRMPVIPEINDSHENITRTAEFLHGTGHKTIHCLPYHDFWQSKIAAIDTDIDFVKCRTADEKTMEQVKALFKKEKINAVIYGL